MKQLFAGIFTALIISSSLLSVAPFQAHASVSSFVGLVYTCQGTTIKPTGQTYPGTSVDTSQFPNREHECDFVDFINAIKHIMDYVFGITVPIAIIAFMYAGIKLLTAQGNQGKVTEAKRIFVTVLTGFGFILAAWLLIFTIAKGLNCTDCLQFLQH